MSGSLELSGRPSMEHSIFPLQRNILFSIFRTFMPTLYVYTSCLTRSSTVRFSDLLKVTLAEFQTTFWFNISR